MARKHYQRTPKKRTRRRSRGKGTSYITTRNKVRLLSIGVGIYFVFYAIEQFSLLIANPEAVSPFGWFVMSLLIVSITSIAGVKLRKLFHYKNDKKKYETSLYYKESAIPYKTLKTLPGKLFEYAVSQALETAFPNTEQLCDLTLRRKDSVNEFVQIDCVLMHETGIYVLELKDYKGYVYGSRTSRFWNVGYETNGKKATYEFQNPILQNEGHIKDLKAMKEADYQNIVMFSPNTTIDTTLSELHTLHSLKTLILSRVPIYTINDLKDIKGSIESFRTREKTSEHIKRIEFNKVKYT